MEPGDRAVLYTDGILETKNPSQEEFGINLFKRFLDINHALGANEFVDSLLLELSRWSGNPMRHGQQDDVTILAIDFNPH